MDIVDRLVELIAIPSVSGGEDAICDSIEALCRRAKPGWSMTRIGNNLVLGPSGARDAGGAAPDRELIALVGHVDTVPPDGNETPEIHDGKIHGRGACDMKAGIAIMCDLVETLPDDRLPVDVVFIFYDNEETNYDANGLGKVIPACPFLREVDLAFVLESSRLELELGCNGHVNAWVTFHGTAAHSARPWMGKNAIHLAGAFIAKIADIPINEVTIGGVTFREVISVTLANGGKTRNVVPDRCEINVNYRYPPDRSPEDAERYVRGLLPDGATLEIRDAAPPGPVPAGNPILERFRTRYALGASAKQGWTDVARLAEEGIDALNFGPGDPHYAHHRDEHVPIDKLRRCREMLFDFLTGRNA